jgi:hypothetical protein
MIRSIRTGLLLSATALALVAAPAVLNATPLSDLSVLAGGKGNGNGGGGGNSGDHGNSGGNGNSDHSSGGNGASKKVADVEDLTTTGKVAKTKNLKAQVAGLNSLNRNINGLMNSSDPRMAGIRDFIAAGAASQAAAANLAQANLDLTAAMGAYNTYAAGFALTTYEDGLAYTDLSLGTLQTRATTLQGIVDADATNLAAAAELTALNAAILSISTSTELAALTTAQGAVAQYTADVALYGGMITDEALKAALLAAANDNRVAEAGTDVYLTPEIMAWAQGKIDVLTEAYVAQQ